MTFDEKKYICKMGKNGRITLPEELQQETHSKPGDTFEVKAVFGDDNRTTIQMVNTKSISMLSCGQLMFAAEAVRKNLPKTMDVAILCADGPIAISHGSGIEFGYIPGVSVEACVSLYEETAGDRRPHSFESGGKRILSYHIESPSEKIIAALVIIANLDNEADLALQEYVGRMASTLISSMVCEGLSSQNR